jgi:hypothetical protein
VFKFLQERGLREDKTQTTKNFGRPEEGVHSVIRGRAKKGLDVGREWMWRIIRRVLEYLKEVLYYCRSFL